MGICQPFANPNTRHGRVFLILAALTCVTSVSGQEFSRILTCEGTFQASGSTPVAAHADLAMRYNNRTVVIERSNVLPVGERLNYSATSVSYGMTYQRPRQGTTVITVPGWFTNTILIAYPNLRRLNQIRMSVDRRSGTLEGVMMNEEEENLGSFNMACDAIDEGDQPKRKF